MANDGQEYTEFPGFDMRGFTSGATAAKSSAYDHDMADGDDVADDLPERESAEARGEFPQNGDESDAADEINEGDDGAESDAVADVAVEADDDKPSSPKISKKSLFKVAKNAVKAETPALFSPITLRSVTARNRVWLPPMDTYSAFAGDGKPTPFHYQHYVSRAVGGFGLVCMEATAVSPEGRISINDLGLWNDDQVEAFKWIVADIKQAGAVAAVQLNHSGRKGSQGSFSVGYDGESLPFDRGGWQTVAPSPIAFGRMAEPRELGVDEIHRIVDEFRAAAERAVRAGFEVIEIHAAHGYLLSEFLDPLTNMRTDEYGGGLSGRYRLLLEVTDAIRGVIPETMPLFVRVSATDWAAGGWDLNQTIETARLLKEHGVDLVDVSTGGLLPGVAVPVKPDYQVPFSQQVRSKALVPTTAVGLITKPKQADRVVRKGEVDAVQIGRAALRDPYWPLRAAGKLGLSMDEAPYQPQYLRGAF